MPKDQPRLRPIMLVEDKHTNAMLLQRAFGQAKVLNPIVRLKDSDAALAYLSGEGAYKDRFQHPLPAVVLFKFYLPGMTGLELLQWRRTRPEIQRIPFIALTAHDRPATIKDAYVLGANSHVATPPNREEIARLIEVVQRYWLELNEPVPLAIDAKQRRGAGGRPEARRDASNPVRSRKAQK